LYLEKQEILKNYRVVFMGSPQFAVPILMAIHENFNLVAVVTQPDKPAGRGKRIEASAVKKYAVDHTIPVLEPHKLRKEPENMEALKNYQADLFIVAAYGQILPPAVLEIPKYGCINIHASLLPRWRGASPIQAAILNGDMESGVTIMKMDAGMDTGPILKQNSVALAFDESGESLSKKLSELGRDLLLEVVPDYLAGGITSIPQDDEEATYAPLIKKEDGQLDLHQPAEILERKIRAFNPWPGTFLQWDEKLLKILEVEIMQQPSQEIGKRGTNQKFPTVSCVGGTLVLKKVQVPGKNVVSGKDFLNGVRNWVSS
jgi:methionyl-tRNA formyltransferase